MYMVRNERKHGPASYDLIASSEFDIPCLCSMMKTSRRKQTSPKHTHPDKQGENTQIPIKNKSHIISYLISYNIRYIFFQSTFAGN